MNSSGAAAIYQINNAGTVFWTWIPNNGTTCAASPAVPNDDDNWPAAVSRCGGTIRVGNNTMEWNGSAATYQGSPCYFTATATGMKVTAAGITAGVTVLAYVLHNGNIGSCPKISPKGHWMVVCGGLCGDNTGCV